MHSSSLEKIESLRRELYTAAKNKKLSDPDVVAISQKLDYLLNKLGHFLKKDSA